MPPQENSLNVFVLPPLPDSLVLPPLPEITDPQLAKMAVTHASISQLPRISTTVELESGEVVDDYEKLEHVGDGILGCVVTCLLHDLYPRLGPGIATMLKTHLVSNNTLAQLSVRYGLPDRLIASKSALWITRAQQKTKANLFESHVAGVFYSCLQSELPRGPSTISVIMPGNSPKFERIGSEDQEQSSRAVIDDDEEEEEAVEKGEEAEAIIEDEDQDQDEDMPLSATHPVARPSLADSIDSAEQSAASMTNEDITSDSEKILKECLQATLASVSERADEAHQTIKASTSSIPEQQGPNTLSQSTPSRSPGCNTHTNNTSSSQTVKPSCRSPTRGQAFDYLDSWLRPLYIPVAEWALNQMKKEQARLDHLYPPPSGVVVADPFNDALMVGARGVLSQHVIDRMKGPPPQYSFLAHERGGWKVTCKVINKIGEEWSAEAIRPSKKLAAAVAAYDVCRQLRLDVA